MMVVIKVFFQSFFWAKDGSFSKDCFSGENFLIFYKNVRAWQSGLLLNADQYITMVIVITIKISTLTTLTRLFWKQIAWNFCFQYFHFVILEISTDQKFTYKLHYHQVSNQTKSNLGLVALCLYMLSSHRYIGGEEVQTNKR